MALDLFGQASDPGADEPRLEQASSCLTVLPNLDGWYDFDSLTSPTVGVGGLGPDAVWMGSPVTVPGQVGAALSFNGSSYLEVTNSTAFNYPTQSFSVSLWIRTTASGSAFLDKRCTAQAGGCSSPQGWALGVSPAGHLQFLMGSPLPYFYEGFSAYSLKKINDGQWHFVSVSVDRRAPRLVFAVDPQTESDVQTISLEGYAGAIPSVRPLRIGGDQSSFLKFVGDLDEVQIYARSITASEVLSIQAAGPGGQCRPPACSPVSARRTLVGWYSFEETAGVVWQDRAGQNNYLAGSAEQVVGQSGFAVQLAMVGANSGLRTLDSAPEQDVAAGNFAMAAWIRYFPAAGQRRAIIDKTSDDGGGYALFLDEGYLRFSMNAAGQARSSASSWVGMQTRLDDGQWHHIAVVVDRTAVAPELYVDGRREDQGRSRGPMITASLSNRAPLLVGAFSHEASSTFGAIDELTILNSTLSPGEVQSIYDAAGTGYCRRNDQGCIVPPAGLLSWYRFENASGGFDDAGAAPSEPMVVAGPVTRSVGRVGRGIRLAEPTSALRTLGATSKLNFENGPFSFSFWVLPGRVTGSPSGSPGTRTLLEKMTYTSPPNAVRATQGYRLRLVNGRLELALASAGNLGIWTGGTTLRADQWALITVNIPRDNGPAVFVNGRAESLAAGGTVNGGSLSTPSALLVGISAEATQNPSDAAPVEIDELAFYGRALGLAEVQALAAANLGQCFEGLSGPVRAVYEVNTSPERIGATVGVSGDSSALNGYATTIAPSAVTVSPTLITTAAGTEYRFRNWSLNGIPNPEWTSAVQTVPLPMNASSYTANYETFHRLQVSVTGSCQVTPLSGLYLSGSSRPLTISLSRGWVLGSATWTSAGQSRAVANGDSLTLSGPAALEVVCRDATVFPITISTWPAIVGLQTVADGTTIRNSQSFAWPAQPPRILDVPQQIQVVGLTQYTFRRWRNATNNQVVSEAPVAQTIVQPAAAATYVAEFDPTGYQIIVKPPTGCVLNVSPSPAFLGFYAPGTRLTVSLIGTSGYAPGLLTIQPLASTIPATRSSPAEIVLDGPVTISGQCTPQVTTVRFMSSAPAQARLSMSFTSSFNNTPVTVQGNSPISMQVGPGLLTLTAAPTAVGDDRSIQRFREITPGNFLNGAVIPSPSVNTTYVANYEVHCYQLDLSLLPAAGGSSSVSLLSGEKPYLNESCYTPGSVVSISVFPKPGYQFTGWTGDASGNATTTQVTVLKALTIGAQFQLTPP